MEQPRQGTPSNEGPLQFIPAKAAYAQAHGNTALEQSTNMHTPSIVEGHSTNIPQAQHGSFGTCN